MVYITSTEFCTMFHLLSGSQVAMQPTSSRPPVHCQVLNFRQVPKEIPAS